MPPNIPFLFAWLRLGMSGPMPRLYFMPLIEPQNLQGGGFFKSTMPLLIYRKDWSG